MIRSGWYERLDLNRCVIEWKKQEYTSPQIVKEKKIIIIRDKEIKEAEKETKYEHSSDIIKVL